jgi:hypothetical protein
VPPLATFATFATLAVFSAFTALPFSFTIAKTVEELDLRHAPTLGAEQGSGQENDPQAAGHVFRLPVKYRRRSSRPP